jgi:hypothetical protein
MKSFKIVFMLLVLSMATFAQTEDLGLGAFANDKSDIMLAVDAGVAIRDVRSPYAMFVVYMASKKQGQDIVVGRNDVTLVYEGQEYKMPSLRELRKNYGAEIRDITLSRHLGKEGIAASWIRFYQFPNEGDFFPPLTPRAGIKKEQGSMSGFFAFRTKCYFKNPGFKAGDKIIIRVTAKNKPDLTSEVEVVL